MSGNELDWEMETVNAFMTGDPFEGIELPDWSKVSINESGWVGGTVTNVTKTKIKNGKNKGAAMAFVNLESDCGVIDGVIFNRQWVKFQNDVKFGKTLLLFGEKTGDLSMTVDSVMTLEQYKKKVGV